jgi:hypothetical protein
MKHLFISAGMVAAGAAGLQSAWAANPDIISPKDWNVAASLRGFYDDNYNISSTQKGSFGVEITPTISFNIPMQQTDFGLKYTYGLYYYNDRDSLGLNPFDQTHQVDVWLDHSFNERWKLNLTDTFAAGQEPELLGPTSPSYPNGQQFRIEGDNIANHASITLSTDWTRQFSTALHYNNSFYDYSNSGTTLGGPTPSGIFPVLPVSTPGGSGFNQLSGNGASYAGLLNRVEQSVGLDLQWHFQKETVGFIGYNFSLVNYTGNEPIGVFNYLDTTYNPLVPGSGQRSVVYQSDSRDSMTHYAYVGVQHAFTSNLSGTVRGGLSYTDSYNDPLQNSTSLSPYADLSVSYTYIPGSYVQIGFTHDINSTDVATVDAHTGSLTQYQESSVIYADINHHITPKLVGTVIGRCQISSYEGGPYSSNSDTDYNLGVNLNYQFNTHFWAEVGYNYDDLVSDLAGRSYTRNRVYLGLGASY